MRRDIFHYLEIAAQTAVNKQDERSFLIGCVGIRNDGTLVKSLNGPSKCPTREAHAEYRCCNKLDVGATLYVARVRICDGAMGMSRPCQNCLKKIKSKRVKRVYYTIAPGEFGLIDLDREFETIHSAA